MQVRLALHAMATRFELILAGDDPVRLRAAGEDALREIERLDAQLSAYRPSSELSGVNAKAAAAPVRVEPRVFALLSACVACSRATDGAFDPTIGPLMRAWKMAGGPGEVPAPEALAMARGVTGERWLTLDASAHTVRFARPGVALDLGAAGKGYAIDRAIDLLREHGVRSALLHGGTSSVHVIGAPPDDEEGWKVAWTPPDSARASARVLTLRDRAASISGQHGKSFVHEGRRYGHVIDPRSGAPVHHTRAAGVVGPRSCECDVLSTALLVQGAGWLPSLQAAFPEYVGWTAD